MSFKDLVHQNLDALENTFDESLSGIHIYDESKVWKGSRLFDGFLIDYKGNILQEFDFKYLSVFCSKGYVAQDGYESKHFGLFTKKNKKIWVKKHAIHHDIFPLQDSFFTFGKACKKYKGRLVDFDIIEHYDYSGKKLFSWHAYSNLKDLQKLHPKFPLDIPKIPLIPDFVKRKSPSPWGGLHDYYRFNSFQVIPKNVLEKENSSFKAGNWLISARHGSLIFIIDKDTQKIVWSLSYKDIKNHLEGQHAVQMLENGNILMFDNGRYRGWSRIIEINPITKEIMFEYKAKDFFSLSRGYVQKLPNDNYLITESEKGRIFEITKDKELVWEYYHPKQQNNPQYPQSQGKRDWIYRCYGV
ncbi:MAG: arylsulfotransferase family protein [Candidatus Woesearchaeota archaeon]